MRYKNFSRLLPDDFFITQGCNADSERCYGLTTAIAMKIIAEAIMSKGKMIRYKDRVAPVERRSVAIKIRSLIDKLDLKYFEMTKDTLQYNVFIKIPVQEVPLNCLRRFYEF